MKVASRGFLDSSNVPSQCNSTNLSCQGLPVNTSACCQFDSIYICNATQQWFIVPCPFATICVGGGNATGDALCFGPGDSSPLVRMSSLPHFLEGLLKTFSFSSFTCTSSFRSAWRLLKEKALEQDFWRKIFGVIQFSEETPGGVKEGLPRVQSRLLATISSKISSESIFPGLSFHRRNPTTKWFNFSGNPTGRTPSRLNSPNFHLTLSPLFLKLGPNPQTCMSCCFAHRDRPRHFLCR
jgi:hypothetical protein